MIADMIRDPAVARQFLDDPDGFMSARGTAVARDDLEALKKLAENSGAAERAGHMNGHFNIVVSPTPPQ